MISPSAASDLVFTMLRVNTTLSLTLDLLVAPLDITGTEWRVLRLIGASPHGLTVPHIARKLGMTRQGVQRLAEGLCERGFMAFEANEDHATSRRGVLTRMGREAFRQGRGNEYDLGKRMMLDLTDEEIRATSTLLEKLRVRFRVDHAHVAAATVDEATTA